MKNLSIILSVCALLSALLIAGCAGSAAPTLNQTSWQLIDLNGKKLPLYVQITLEFKDGQAGGKAPCNGYGAEYTQDNHKIALNEIISTLMYCEGVMDYENEYFSALSAVKSFKLENDVLMLLDESGSTVLAFGKPQPFPTLAGSSWNASVVGEIVVPEGVEVTLSFEDGKISGKAACNTYFADYTQTDGTLTFDAPGATEMYCNEEGIMELESAFLSHLQNVQKFEIQTGGLVLLDGTGQPLIYLRP